MSTETESPPFGTDQALVDSLVLRRLPRQGEWNEEQYLWLTDHSNQLVDGAIEVLPMPTDQHQSVLLFIYELFVAFLRPRGGKVHFAPLRMHIREGTFREPDLLLLCDAADPRRQNRFCRC